MNYIVPSVWVAATGLQGTELTPVRPRRGLKSQVLEGPWAGSKKSQASASEGMGRTHVQWRGSQASASEGMGRTHVQWRGLPSQVTLLPSPR